MEAMTTDFSPFFPPRRRAWAVVRTSTTAQCDSLEAQMEDINKYLSLHNELELAGVKSLQESAYSLKPGKLDEFIKEELQSGDILIFTKVDRFSRNTRDFGRCLEKIKEANIEVHFIANNIVWTKDCPRDVENKICELVVKAEQESLEISGRVKRTNRIRRSRGEITYQAPIGYENYQEGREKGWRIHGTEGKIVKQLFEAYATGNYSIQTIAQMAYNKGLYGRVTKNSKACKKLCNQSVVNMLTNKFYIGWAKDGDRYYKHTYPCLISEDLFNKCQEVYQGRSTGHVAKAVNIISAFRGLLKHRESGKVFTPYNQKGNIYFKSPVSGLKDPKGKILDQRLMTVLEKVGSNGDLMDFLESNLNPSIAADKGLAEEKLATLIKDKEVKAERRYNIISTSNLSGDLLADILARFEKEISELEKSIVEAQSDLGKYDRPLIKLGDSLKKGYQDLTLENQAKVLNLIFSEVVYHEGVLDFVMTKEAAAIINKSQYVVAY